MQENRSRSRTIHEEMARERKYWKQNQLWTLMLAIAIIVSLFAGPSLSVAPGAEELTLTMHSKETLALAYDSITAAELLEAPQYGTVVDGKGDRNGKSGTWEHPQWGAYTLCVYASCDQAVRILTEEHCYVVNLRSEAETQQLYQIILDKMPASR